MSVLAIQLDINGVWRLSSFYGMLACMLFFVWRQKDKIGIPLCALWGYVLGRALYSVEYPSLPYGNVNMAFMASAGMTLAEILLIPMVVINLSQKALDNIMKVISFLAIVQIIAVWKNVNGIMLASSLDVALLALLIPFASPLIVAAIVATILTRHSTTATLMLSSYLAIWTMRDKRLRPLLLLIPVLIFIAYYHHLGPRFDTTERLEAWTRFFKFWATNKQYMVLGTGTGSFIWLSMMIDKFKNPIWLFMHSDWLQILFELGVVGVVLSITAYLTTLYKCRKNTKVFSAMIGCFIFACTYHPMRFFPSAFLVALIFNAALKSGYCSSHIKTTDISADAVLH